MSMKKHFALSIICLGAIFPLQSHAIVDSGDAFAKTAEIAAVSSLGNIYYVSQRRDCTWEACLDDSVQLQCSSAKKTCDEVYKIAADWGNKVGMTKDNPEFGWNSYVRPNRCAELERAASTCVPHDLSN